LRETRPCENFPQIFQLDPVDQPLDGPSAFARVGHVGAQIAEPHQLGVTRLIDLDRPHADASLQPRPVEKSANPHILMMSPPLDLREKWFAPHTAYSMAKYGMSLVVLGLAGELREKRIAVNALWPRTTIATAAVKNLLGGDRMMQMSRAPDIVADTAYLIFQKPSRAFTGRYLIDDSFLASEGITDFERYRVDPTNRSRRISSFPMIVPRRQGSSSPVKVEAA
jgi:NAD(P)-dependent dehydrogenase (short-subunit alcohol dehydrogenase family)